MHVIGRVLSDTATLAMLEDGTVYLDAGVLVYRVPDDGPIALVGDRASYDAFLPADDGPPILRSRARSFFGTKDAPVMSEGTEAYALTNRVWTTTKTRVTAALSSPVRTRELRRDTSTAVLPTEVKVQPRFERTTYRRRPDGTFIGLGREHASSRSTPAPTPLVVRPGSTEETLVPIPDATGAWRCEQAPSSDGKAYVDCRAHDGAGDERRLYVLDRNTWARVLLPSRDLDAPLAIAKDGSIYMGLSDPPRLAVRSPGGRITGAPLPMMAPDSLGRASYLGKSTRMNLPRPRHHAVEDLDKIVDLAPTAGGSMIILARELDIDGALVVLRTGGAAVERPDVVGSEIDQLVEIRNAAEPKRWIGHCATVFVELPRGRDAGEISLLPVTDGSWVEGRLHDRTVTGVVFANASSDESSFESVVAAFVERNTTNPTAPPEVTCTLPVLDAVK